MVKPGDIVKDGCGRIGRVISVTDLHNVMVEGKGWKCFYCIDPECPEHDAPLEIVAEFLGGPTAIKVLDEDDGYCD